MTQHLIVLPDRDVAQQIADDLLDEGFTDARVVRMPLAGDDDADEAEWGVHVLETNVVDESRPVEQGLRARFQALADEHGGWYDPEPGG